MGATGMTNEELSQALELQGKVLDRELLLLAAARLRNLSWVVENWVSGGDDGSRRVRHVRRGSTYVVAKVNAELQSSAGPVAEGAQLAVYVGEDGRAWARPRPEFEDGRFEDI